jgi:hypothetical protein
MLPPIRAQFLALLLLTGLVILVERLIVTDQEAIRGLGREVARAAGARDTEALGRLLAPGFRHGPRDAAQTLAHVAALLRKYPAQDIAVDFLAIEVDDGEATATGLVSASLYGRPVQVQVQVDLREEDEGWKLVRVRGGEGLR